MEEVVKANDQTIWNLERFLDEELENESEDGESKPKAEVRRQGGKHVTENKSITYYFKAQSP